MRSKVLALAIGISALFVLMAAPGASAAPVFDRSCGIPPGDGYVNWVRVANMTCRHGVRVSLKARKKFCAALNDCSDLSDAGVVRGTVYRNGWRCKVKVGYEIFRAKCRRGDQRVIYLVGA